MAESATNLLGLLGSASHVQTSLLGRALGHKTGAVTPIGAVTPEFVGQEYLDTVTGTFYRATSTANTDWSVLGITGLTSAELGVLDGVTAGTVIASKAIVTDSGIKINGLLQSTYGAGTATVAPIVLTIGTNLTTAAAGATEYDGVVFYDTSAASSRQVRDTEQFICLTANFTASDTASAQKVFNSPTAGALTVQALTSYFFEGQYIISNTGTTSHTWGTLFGLTTATLTSISYVVQARTGTTSAVTITASSSLHIAAATVVPVTAASTSATEFVIINLRGVMRVNAAGIVTPQIQASAQPGASGTPGVTVLAGSFFRMWPVGSNTVASVGNWS